MSNVPMTLSELLISQQARPFAHTSSHTQLEDGRIFHASYGAWNESRDGGLTWSKTGRLRDINGADIFATSVIRLSAPKSLGLVGLIPSPLPSPTGRVKRYVAFWRSDDEGRTWQSPTPVTSILPDGEINILQDTMIRTRSGRIVVPVYTELGQTRKMGDHQGRVVPMDGKLVGNQWVSTTAHHFDTIFGYCYEPIPKPFDVYVRK